MTVGGGCDSANGQETTYSHREELKSGISATTKSDRGAKLGQHGRGKKLTVLDESSGDGSMTLWCSELPEGLAMGGGRENNRCRQW